MITEFIPALRVMKKRVITVQKFKGHVIKIIIPLMSNKTR
jgi:hypothetical protein